jgi:hypothetical protein
MQIRMFIAGHDGESVAWMATMVGGHALIIASAPAGSPSGSRLGDSQNASREHATTPDQQHHIVA